MTDSDPAAPALLDLRGVPCPLAWAKAKVHLETLATGTLVDLLTDDPRSTRDIPRAAEASGHLVIEVDVGPDAARIRLEV